MKSRTCGLILMRFAHSSEEFHQFCIDEWSRVFKERDKGHDSEQVSAVLLGVVRCLHPAGRRDGVKEGGSVRGREGRALLRVEIETEVQNSTRFSPTDRSSACSLPAWRVLAVNWISVMLMILQIQVQTKLGLEILREED
ncbi:hypothetical protein PGIGA_G00053830 [Pangasianodon gigas]|uniref:Uncharacterized protein n=1 Tax=Pangasianodon gigas TaxID=30993 RepID=A0ACC5X593_PANGG|nr:hypothetical protein [Pangasianodon gigas]